jgi:hypothetical protein
MDSWEIKLTIWLTLGFLTVATVVATLFTRSACRRAIVRAAELTLKGQHKDAMEGLQRSSARLGMLARFFTPDLWAEMLDTLRDIEKHKRYGDQLQWGEEYHLRDMIHRGTNPFLAYPARRKELEEMYPEILRLAREKFGRF